MIGFLKHMVAAAKAYGVKADEVVEMAPIIEFYCPQDLFGCIPEPVSAAKRMPEWFKKTKPEVEDGGRDHFGGIGSTAKRCMPLMDAMTLGYTIPMFADVNIRTDHSKNLSIENSPHRAAETHPVGQFGGANAPTKFPAVKFINHWTVKTPPGWSTLFVPPVNSTEDRFRCLAAVVDTDTYKGEINFPALWFATDYDGIVKAGTPLVTAIPFKRDTTHIESLVRRMAPGEAYDAKTTKQIQSLRNSYYSKELREPR